MSTTAHAFEYGEFASMRANYYKNNSCLSSKYLDYKHISYINSALQRVYGRQANAQVAA
jgi:hypothetical protein